MTGTGTENDPYIVGTWEEWLAVNDISASTYIKWGDAPKNKKVIQSSSVGANYLSGKGVVDFNDWTFVGFQGIYCNRGSEGAYPKFSNGIMVSVVSTDGSIIESLGSSSHAAWTIENFRISGAVSGNGIKLINSSPYVPIRIKNSVINVDVNARYGDKYEEYLCYCNSGSYSPQLRNCHIVIRSNVVLECYNFDLYNNLFEGTIDTDKTSSRRLTYTSYSSQNIWNIECSRPLSVYGSSICLYNSDTCDITGTNYVGLSSAELGSQEAVTAAGFSIGTKDIPPTLGETDFESGGILFASGEDSDNPARLRTPAYYEYTPGLSLTWNGTAKNGAGLYIAVFGYDSSLNFVSAYYWHNSGNNITGIDPSIEYLRFVIKYVSESNIFAEEITSVTVDYASPWYMDGITNDGYPYNKYFPEPLGAFYNATELSKVSIPQSVKKIGRYSFWGTGLAEVTIARDCEYYPTSFPDGCVINFYPD